MLPGELGRCLRKNTPAGLQFDHWIGRSAYSGKRGEAGRPIPVVPPGVLAASGSMLSTSWELSGTRDHARKGCGSVQRMLAHVPMDVAGLITARTSVRSDSGRRRGRGSGRGRGGEAWAGRGSRTRGPRGPVRASLRPGTRASLEGSWRDLPSRSGRANYSAWARAGQSRSRRCRNSATLHCRSRPRATTLPAPRTPRNRRAPLAVSRLGSLPVIHAGMPLDGLTRPRSRVRSPPRLPTHPRGPETLAVPSFLVVPR